MPIVKVGERTNVTDPRHLPRLLESRKRGGFTPCTFSDNLRVVDVLSCVFDALSSTPATCGPDNCYFQNLSSAYNTVCNQILTPHTPLE